MPPYFGAWLVGVVTLGVVGEIVVGGAVVVTVAVVVVPAGAQEASKAIARMTITENATGFLITAYPPFSIGFMFDLK